MKISVRELAILSMGFAFGWTGTARAQAYPHWFLNQGEIPGGGTVVGYARASLYPDSAAARAIRDGWTTFSRQARTEVTGGQAFWATEAGTAWMGSSFRERYDTTSVAKAGSLLCPLDTLLNGEMVAVLLGSGPGSLPESMRVRREIRDLPAPEWIESPPGSPDDLCVVGVSPAYQYETSSWEEAERTARLSLARAIHVSVQAHQKVSGEWQEIRNEEVSVTLRNVRTVARWRDAGAGVFYVLLRMHR